MSDVPTFSSDLPTLSEFGLRPHHTPSFNRLWALVALWGFALVLYTLFRFLRRFKVVIVERPVVVVPTRGQRRSARRRNGRNLSPIRSSMLPRDRDLPLRNLRHPRTAARRVMPRFPPYDEHGRRLAFCGRCFTVVVDDDHIDCQGAPPPYEP